MKITVADPFDMDAVAEQFPGQLVFRGCPAAANGVTEITGDVPAEELLAAVNANGLVADAPVALPTVITGAPPATRSRLSWRRLAALAGPTALALELAERLR